LNIRVNITMIEVFVRDGRINLLQNGYNMIITPGEY